LYESGLGFINDRVGNGTFMGVLIELKKINICGLVRNPGPWKILDA
jgi:hypothetical protein